MKVFQDIMWDYQYALSLMFLLTFANEKVPYGQNLIVFIIDGYGNTLLNQSDAGLRLLAQNGVHSEYLKPVYPTHNYPNWMSLVTGIYAENHGFGADYMWDRKTNRAFWKGDTNSTDDGWWWSGAAAPAWYTAGKSNIDVHCYWIPGCDLPYQDMIVQVPRERRYNASAPEQTDALATYFPEIVERIVKYQSYKQQERLSNAKLFDSTNVVVLSTHGLYKVDSEEQFYIEECLADYSKIQKIVNHHAMMMIFTDPDELDEVFFELKVCDQWAPMGDYDENEQPLVAVYRTTELPDRFHWKNFRYMPEIVLITRPGATVLTRELPSIPLNEEYERDIRQTGGWDNENVNMHGIFLARGPAFKRGYQASFINMVDIYQVMLNIFGIEPPHRHNGTWTNVEDFLSSGWEARSTPENVRPSSATSSQSSLHLITLISSSFYYLFSSLLL